jgi:MFS family permease
MNNTAIRLCGGTALGALFGILCFYGFASQPDMTPALKKLATWSTSNFLMWEMIVNRAMIGFLVGLAGFMTVHPLFGFKLPSVLRGFVMGIFGTLTMSFGVLIGGVNDATLQAFWITTLAGGVIGLIIDVILTKFAGQGSDLKS